MAILVRDLALRALNFSIFLVWAFSRPMMTVGSASFYPDAAEPEWFLDVANRSPSLAVRTHQCDTWGVSSMVNVS